MEKAASFKGNASFFFFFIYSPPPLDAARTSGHFSLSLSVLCVRARVCVPGLSDKMAEERKTHRTFDKREV